jgi:D-glycero-D-manno-heptose 1,7-bisphosphate phosphatase
MSIIDKRVPVLYLDLDGTVRHGKTESGRFVNCASDVLVFPQVPALLARYKNSGWRIVAVSNQGGVALGLLTQDACISAMAETNRQAGKAFDKMLWCQHHPEAKEPEMAVCWCRKPRPGLIIEAAHALRGMHQFEIYPPHMALMVGDRPEDRAAAEGAGVPFMDAAEWRMGAHAFAQSMGLH